LKNYLIQQEELTLVQRCIKGDSIAEKELYLKYVNAMYHTAIRMIGNEQDAKDVVQEVFIKVFDQLPNFRGDASLGAWIKRITINTCLTHFRKQKNLDDELVTSKLYTQAPEEQDENLDRVSMIHRAIKRLPARARMVFCMRTLEGYTHEEIANMLSITSSTSKTQYKRAKELIQSMLKTTC